VYTGLRQCSAALDRRAGRRPIGDIGRKPVAATLVQDHTLSHLFKAGKQSNGGKSCRLHWSETTLGRISDRKGAIGVHQVGGVVPYL